MPLCLLLIIETNKNEIFAEWRTNSHRLADLVSLITKHRDFGSTFTTILRNTGCSIHIQPLTRDRGCSYSPEDMRGEVGVCTYTCSGLEG